MVVNHIKKVICYIQAFDCEYTIKATMESVLNQTYDNWLCFVLSNGNCNLSYAPNHSLDIINKTAARDKRFVVLNKKYNSLDMYIPTLYHLAKKFPDSYICSLDSDDEYLPDFFERAVALAEEENLDIVACGTELILKKNVRTKRETPLSKRALKEDLIIKGEDYTKKFNVYKPFFNEMWGKLYRTELFGEEYDWKYAEKNFFLHFLPDTLFTIDNLSRSKAIGILSGTSHKFYQFEQRKQTNATAVANEFAANNKKSSKITISNFSLVDKNIFSVYDTYNTIMRFLRSRGTIDKELYEYMQAVLFGWYGDLFNRTLFPTTDEAKLAGHIERLIMDPKFDRIMEFKGSGKYNNLNGWQPRIDYCEKLKYLLMGQEIIRNREKRKKNNLPCTTATRKKISKLIAKLDDTIKHLTELERRKK